MPRFIYFIAAGGTFLPGAALLALAVAARAVFSRRWIAALSIAMTVVGVVLIAISAEALAVWIYATWIACTLAWLFRGLPRNTRLKRTIDLAELTITFSAAAMAISYQLRPSLPPSIYPRLYIIGDSVSAGIGGEHGTTWPLIVATDHPDVHVIDLSRAGATLASATRSLQSTPLADGLVFLEIGGNDLIGHASPDRFGQNLDALAQRLRGPGRQVVMLELPLFPFDNAYGLQQRRIASKHGLLLIPRPCFTHVLATPGATVDGIHLSATGQRAMAQMVWEIVGPSLRVGTPTPFR